MVDLTEYKGLYLKTASEYVIALQTNLEMYISDQQHAVVLEVLHRSAHSLKSQSLVMGYQSTGLLAKELEFIYRAMKEGKLIPSDTLSKALADAHQKLYDSLESIKTTDRETELAEVRRNLETITNIKIDQS